MLGSSNTKVYPLVVMGCKGQRSMPRLAYICTGSLREATSTYHSGYRQTMHSTIMTR